MTRSAEVEALIDLFEAEADRDRPKEETPDVGVVMGSDSDLDTMYGAYEALTELGFEEVTDYDDLGEADIVALDAFGAEQAHRYRDYPLSEA